MGRYRAIDEAHLPTLWREGRGRGIGAEYRPMLTVRDTRSRGQSARIHGWKTQRVHHLFTRLEQGFFACVEWSRTVVDIREHFPLLTPPRGKRAPSLTDTASLAARLGLRHPRDAKTKTLKVVTVDFLLTLEVADQRIAVARSMLTHSRIGKRLPTRLQLARAWCAERSIDWGIVTERDIPWGLVQNVQLVRGAYFLPNRGEIARLPDCATSLTAMLLERPETPLNQLGSWCDCAWKLPPGSGLTIIYHLIATRQWEIDMTIPIHPGHHLDVRRVALWPVNEEGVA
jgi:hypothetical protein